MRLTDSLGIEKIFKTEDRIVLGKVSGNVFSEESLTAGQLNHHVHIVGASGYGKTVLISHIIKDRILKNKGLLFIDLKCDVDTMNAIQAIAKAAGRAHEVQMFSLTDPQQSVAYNLILNGTATQLRDKIMMSLVWSEEYYRNLSSSFLLKILTGLCYIRDQGKLAVTLNTILSCTEKPEFIAALSEYIPDSETRIKRAFESCYDFLRQSDQFKALQGLRSQLESLILSDFGDLVSSTENSIDLFKAIENQKIVLIYLDSRKYGETAKVVGRFILQDLKMVSSRIDSEVEKNNRKPFTVIIDEFADLAQEDFIGFLDRARSSKMSVVVAHQEICDLQRISPEFAGRLMGNTSTLYAFLQKRPESAEMISGIAGTRTVWKTTKQTDRFGFFEIDSGKGSKREAEEYVIHPNLIKTLTVGKCVCIKKYPTSRAYLVKVHRD